MSTWALVAINARSRCKTRLADYLSPGERQRLVGCMLNHVLQAIGASTTVRHIAVVSPERDALAADVLQLPDPGAGLNHALMAAAQRIEQLGGKELLILPADLPLVAAADIDALHGAGRKTGFALAADESRQGTNAIFTALPNRVPFAFGVESYLRHRTAAAEQGLQAALVDRPGLSFDVDGYADLVVLADSGISQYAFLKAALRKVEEKIHD